MRLRFLATLLALSLPTLAAADETVVVKAGFMTLNPSGNFSASAGGPAGTPISLDTTLNFKRSNNVTAEAAIQLGDFRLGVQYMPLKFDGSGTLAAPVTFNGVTYTGAVTSQLKADVFDVGLTYYLVNMDDVPSRLQIGVEAAVKITQAQLSMSGGGVSASRSATLPIPTIGARARVALADFIGLSGRIGYLGYAGNKFLDADAQIEFSPLPTLGVYGGYRHIALKVDSSGVLIDSRMTGPYVGGFFRF